MTEKINDTQDLKFYSQKSISIATFIGGPLAAGYLIRANYISLNKTDKGRNALLISVLSTILLFTILLMIPETVLDKIPSIIIPAIYTGIIYVIVEKNHGTILNDHKENDNTFHSGWKAAGIGFISLIILLIGIFGYVFLSMSGEEYDKYYVEMEKFEKNEVESLVFYDQLTDAANDTLLKELENNSIPKWKENIEIIKKSNDIENLPSELVAQNKILLRYATLRLEAFELFKKAFIEDTDEYYQEIEEIHSQINIELDKLN